MQLHGEVLQLQGPEVGVCVGVEASVAVGVFVLMGGAGLTTMGKKTYCRTGVWVGVAVWVGVWVIVGVAVSVGVFVAVGRVPH